MSNYRSLTATAVSTALSLCLLAPIPSHAAGQVDAQAMLMDNFINIAAVGAGIAKVCGSSDAEVEQIKTRQKQQLREQHGSLPADFDQRFDAAVAERVAQAERMSPAQRQQACKEFTESLKHMADQARSRASS